MIGWLALVAMVPMLAGVLWIESGGMSRKGWAGRGRDE